MSTSLPRTAPVPSATTSTAARVRARIAEIRAQCPRPAPPSVRENARRLVVVASSSRGGSSVFAETLRYAAGLLHFRAEINPWLRVHGLAYPESGQGSDALAPEQLGGAPEALDLDLASDCGAPSFGLQSPEELDTFARDLAIRLTIQWPGLAFEWGEVRKLVGEALGMLERTRGWERGELRDAPLFHAAFLARVRTLHPDVNPYYYDLPPALVREFCPDALVPSGPPGDELIEEPPFVTIVPWRTATAEQLQTQPLVVKTPSNVYRLEALRAYFGGARLSVLHLTRNAAASLNGLYDGWRYRGFFSHRVPVGLDIAGYTDSFPEWSRHWWKFDLPPGWQQLAGSPLERVCGFQWQSAHRAVLDFLARHPEVDRLRVPFERAVGALDERAREFAALAHWLRLDEDLRLAKVMREGLPPVMATDRPRQRRWFARASQLEPVLATQEIRRTMEELGYEPRPETWL